MSIRTHGFGQSNLTTSYCWHPDIAYKYQLPSGQLFDDGFRYFCRILACNGQTDEQTDVHRCHENCVLRCCVCVVPKVVPILSGVLKLRGVERSSYTFWPTLCSIHLLFTTRVDQTNNETNKQAEEKRKT